MDEDKKKQKNPAADDWSMTMPHLKWQEQQNQKVEPNQEYLKPPSPPPLSTAPSDWELTEPNINVPDFDNQQLKSPKPVESFSSKEDWVMDKPADFTSPASQDFSQTIPNLPPPKHFSADSSAAESGALPPIEPPAFDFEKTEPNLQILTDPTAKTEPEINIPPLPKPAEWDVSKPAIPVSNTEGNSDDEHWSMPKPTFRVSEGATLPSIQIPASVMNELTEPNLFKVKQTPSAAESREEKKPEFDLPPLPPPPFTETSNVTASGAESQVEPLIIYPSVLSTPAPTRSYSAAEIGETRNFKLTETTDAIKQTAVPVTAESSNSKWYLLLGGLFVLFFLLTGTLIGAYFLFFNNSKSAPVNETKTIEPIAAAPVESKVETPSSNTGSEFNLPASATEPKSLAATIDLRGTMVLVSAGKFIMGSDNDETESKPAHEIELPAFYIDKYEVTNRQYKEFCDATGKNYPLNPHWNTNYFTERPNAPVLGVSFADAQAYAAWAGKRLPSEAEWEKAASWDAAAQKKYSFPWGDKFERGKVAFGAGIPDDVGKHTDGASPSGAMDMAGNVLEWVNGYFEAYPNSTAKNAAFGKQNRIVRGGHFGSKDEKSLKTTKRIYVPPDLTSKPDAATVIGFRCAISASDVSTERR